MRDALGHILDQHDGIRQTADIASIGIAVGALVGWLPALAAALTVIWTGIRIFETKTVQRLLGRSNGEEP